MKNTILLSGSNGFIGSSLIKALRNNFEILLFNFEDTYDTIYNKVSKSQIIIHSSAVSRSNNEEDFFKVNFHLTSLLSEVLLNFTSKKIIYFSSIHISGDGLYSLSKRFAEYLLGEKLSKFHSVYCFRLPRIFGEGAKPNNVSVVSTFAFNSVFNKESILINPSNKIRLLYIGDLLQLLNIVIQINESKSKFELLENFDKSFEISIEEIEKKMRSFASKDVKLEIMSEIDNNLYKTFLFIKNNSNV